MFSFFRISTTRFQELKGLIEELFDCNGSIYYIPCVNENGKSVPPTGKLYDHYVYIKSDLTKKGLIKKKETTKNITNIVAYKPCGKNQFSKVTYDVLMLSGFVF